jgi:hypothetical protein
MDKPGDRGETSGFGLKVRTRRPPELEPLYALNARCIELLVRAARPDWPATLPLVEAIRAELRSMTPAARSQAAKYPVLLVDMQFFDLNCWQYTRERPTRLPRIPAWGGAFPPSTGVQLARSTLGLAWHMVRSNRQAAALLGMTPEVASIIANLPVTEISPIAEMRARYIRPRWEDRPGVWRRLIDAAQSGEMRKIRAFALYSVQLMTGELLSPTLRS